MFRKVESLCKTDEESSIEGTLKQCCSALDCTQTADRVVRAMAFVEKLGFVLFEGDELSSLVSARSIDIEDGISMDLARVTLQTGKAPRDAYRWSVAPITDKSGGAGHDIKCGVRRRRLE